MRKFKPGEKAIYDAAVRHAPGRQLLMLAIWDIFYPKKRNELHSRLMGGMSWRFAYRLAKEI